MTLTIGIIGLGPIGSQLAKSYVAAGHSVKIANSRGPETLVEKEKETGAKAVKIEDVVKNVDVVVISIPFKAVAQLPKGLFSEVPKDVVVVDTCNYYPEFRDDKVEELDKLTITESEWVSKQIGRPVIKAYNSIMQYSLQSKGTPEGSEDRVALPVAGDDVKAKQIVMRLVNDSGFDGYDAGTLAQSWTQQPGAGCYCTDGGLQEVAHLIKIAQKQENPTMRALCLKKISENQGATPEEMVEIIRETVFPQHEERL